MLSSCHRKARQPDGPGFFKPSAAVKLHCPASASSQGPIPVEVTLDADAVTYWDNQGILDQALQIVLVRRDRPGLMSVAKIDPAAIMMPTPPLPGRPSDEALSRDVGRNIEQKRYDVLAYGRQHPGAADYFVVATFADSWAGPATLKVTDPSGPLAPSPQVSALAAAFEPQNLAPSASPGVFARIGEHAGNVAVVGGFRLSAGVVEKPFLTLLLASLRPKGGILVRQFQVTSRQDRHDLVGTFAVPASTMNRPNPAPSGRHALFAFVGDEAATPTVVDLP